MKHTGPKLQHWREETQGKEKWLAGEPAEHHSREGEFRRRTGGEVWGWNLNFKNNATKGGKTIQEERVEYHLFCFALHYYLLEPEGEPAIVPERE